MGPWDRWHLLHLWRPLHLALPSDLWFLGCLHLPSHPSDRWHRACRSQGYLGRQLHLRDPELLCHRRDRAYLGRRSHLVYLADRCQGRRCDLWGRGHPWLRGHHLYLGLLPFLAHLGHLFYRAFLHLAHQQGQKDPWGPLDQWHRMGRERQHLYLPWRRGHRGLQCSPWRRALLGVPWHRWRPLGRVCQ